jgi:hypothetical protein
MNTLITDHLAVKGAILATSDTTGDYVSNWVPAKCLFLLASLNVGSITGTADLIIEQAQPSLTAVGVTTTASASASATTLAVSGGIFAVDDWVSADGVNFVRVTVAKTTSAAGNLTVSALPADVASGAAVVAVTGVSTVASLSDGVATGVTPWAQEQTTALASEAGVYTLDARGSDFNQNLPTLPTDGTGMGYNPAYYVRVKVTLEVGSTSAVFSAELLGDTIYKPAYNDNAPGVVINRIQA